MMRPARSTEIRLRSMDRLRSSEPCGWNGCEGRGLESRYAWRTPRGAGQARGGSREIEAYRLAAFDAERTGEDFSCRKRERHCVGNVYGWSGRNTAMAGNGGRPWQDPSARRHRALSRAAAGRCGGTRNARYDEAFEIVQAIGMLRARLDEHEEFASELEGIQATYRAKRNFIKLLAKLPWNCPQAVQADSPATRPPPASGRCRRYRKMYAVVLRGVDVHPELTCHAVRLFTTSKANAR